VTRAAEQLVAGGQPTDAWVPGWLADNLDAVQAQAPDDVVRKLLPRPAAAVPLQRRPPPQARRFAPGANTAANASFRHRTSLSAEGN
jgi:hypothetical protein